MTLHYSSLHLSQRRELCNIFGDVMGCALFYCFLREQCRPRGDMGEQALQVQAANSGAMHSQAGQGTVMGQAQSTGLL